MWEGCGVVSDCEELVGVTWRVSDCEELVPNFILNGTKVAQFSNFKGIRFI